MKSTTLIALATFAAIGRPGRGAVRQHPFRRPMAQGAGLVLAGQALEQKAAVRVLLCDAAGDIAVAGKEMPSSSRATSRRSRCCRA
jgi:hypothetical protein